MSIDLRRVELVAARDYLTAVTSRGFLVGLLIMPVMMLIFLVLAPRVLNSNAPRIAGEVAVIDPTSRVSAQLQRALTPADIEARRALESTQGPGGAPGGRGAPVTGSIPDFTVVPLPPGTDLQEQKPWLIQARDALPRPWRRNAGSGSRDTGSRQGCKLVDRLVAISRADPPYDLSRRARVRAATSLTHGWRA